MRCSNHTMGMALRAGLPRADVRVAESEAIRLSDRVVLGGSAIVSSWPEEWRGRPVWVVLSAWGDMPATATEAMRGVTTLLDGLGAPLLELAPRHGGSAAEGVKWALVFETRELGRGRSAADEDVGRVRRP